MKKTTTDQYALAVADAITSLFRDDGEVSPSYHFDLDAVDATAFFTGAIMGLNCMFQRLTGQDKNHLDFTYLCNQLIVQDLLKNKK